MNDRFLITSSGELEMYYTPHNEYINREANIVIVGITPGWTQMRTAFQQAKKCLQQGASLSQLVKSTKEVAGFAGTMRHTLIEMLDECGVHTALNLTSSQQLFHEYRKLLHTTSIMKYPVFIKGKNYTGTSPRVDQSSILMEYAYHVFPKELEQMKQGYLLVPLGKAVTEVIEKLIQQHKLPKQSCLFGFPHPSGANGHRKPQFEKMKPTLQSIVKKWEVERKR